MTKAKEGEFVPGYALHEFPFFIWYTYPQLLLKNAAPRPGSFFDRHGGSVLGRRQHPHKSVIDPILKQRNETATKPVNEFVAAICNFASDHQMLPTTDQLDAQQCLAWLLSWAEQGALLGVMTTKQSYYTRNWALAGLALSYAKVRLAADSATERVIGIWLSRLAEATISNSMQHKGFRNNHFYWEALAVAAVGRLVRDSRYLEWANSVFSYAISQITVEGLLPLELARGRRALAYHSFAAMPLVMLESILNRFEVGIERLVKFIYRSANQPQLLSDLAGFPQETIEDVPNWPMIYQRHRSVEIKPLTHVLFAPRLGGNISIANPLEHVNRSPHFIS